MPAIGSLQQVTLPEQAIGVHVGDVERRMQGLRCRSDVQGNGCDLVLPTLDPTRGDHKEPAEQDDYGDGPGDQDQLLHGWLPCMSNGGPPQGYPRTALLL